MSPDTREALGYALQAAENELQQAVRGLDGSNLSHARYARAKAAHDLVTVAATALLALEEETFDPGTDLP
ncbi:hypothetical protein HUA74_44000 [Myxococcus sp. CA051A]|uniref:hypothetical protein n=1 Tax=Myxococcus sp. CA051A TaxID=2741739 RepID=UPI00157A372D|nr:hypothetical protein [Myxococcus sp. CA051A]NTX67633.1 hypothetical protein [Myxococcus sp. CA051A]